MLRSMFSRLMAVIMAAILVVVIGISALFYVTSRSNYIDSRMDELKVQAYEIAYLASQVRSSALSAFGYSSITENYINWKADTIYAEFNAYSVVVNRTGQITVYMSPALMQESGIEFDKQRIVDTLAEVLKGQEIVQLEKGSQGPMFTVAVPWITGDVVVGAVYIQTAAQTVYATYQGVAYKIALTALAVAALAAVSVFFITRQIVKPLRVMAQMAGDFAQGKFDRRVPVTGSMETQELASAFNLMAGQLETLEQTRRDLWPT